MKKDLKDKIFSKIEKEKIEPIPQSYFDNKNRIIIISIIVVILLGVIFGGFLFDDSYEMFGMGFGYGRGFNSLFFLPNIFWILILIFLGFIGIRNLRETPTGYRNSYSKDIIIGIIIILIGSYIFRGIGFGPAMHSYMVDNFPSVSNTLYNESAWNNPSNGTLAGEIISQKENILELTDINGKKWEVDTSKAFVSPMVSGTQKEKIRIIGQSSGSGVFLADRIMPRFGRGMMNGGSMMGGYGQGRGGMMRNYEEGYGRGRNMMR